MKPVLIWLMALAILTAVYVLVSARSEPTKQAVASNTSTKSSRPPGPPASIPDCPDAIGALPMGRECVPSALKNIPPDPGPAGHQTPEGVDRNDNGVRDDIERWIAANYSDSARLRAGLMQYAKSQQVFSFRPLHSPQEALSIGLQSWRASACLIRNLKRDESRDTEADRRYKAMQQLDLQFLNTPERLRLFIENEKLLAGQVQESPEETDPKKFCEVDPAQLPN